MTISGPPDDYTDQLKAAAHEVLSMTDIVERLLDYDPTRANNREAAAEIKRLRNDYSILKTDYDLLREELADVREDAKLLRADNARLRALYEKAEAGDWGELQRAELKFLMTDNARLRTALESLTHDPPQSLAREPDTDAEVIIKMRAIARAALEPT